MLASVLPSAKLPPG